MTMGLPRRPEETRGSRILTSSASLLSDCDRSRVETDLTQRS
jgi:hypothetical protein